VATGGGNGAQGHPGGHPYGNMSAANMGHPGLRPSLFSAAAAAAAAAAVHRPHPHPHHHPHHPSLGPLGYPLSTLAWMSSARGSY